MAQVTLTVSEKGRTTGGRTWKSGLQVMTKFNFKEKVDWKNKRALVTLL